MGSAMLSYAGCDENYHNDQSYFQLDACSLCQKPLGHNSDIYMYRGNTPFCSQECRQEQIERDEASEKSWKRSSSNSKKALRQTPNASTKKQSTPNKGVRRGIVTMA